MPQETLPEAIGQYTGQYTEHPCKRPAHKESHWCIFCKGEPSACKMSQTVSANNGFVVVTQVYPQQSGTALNGSCAASNVSSLFGKFLKGEPKALGAVQIMIGVMYILCGIAMSIYADSISVFSGISFWGAFIYISSGALSVAAEKKLNKCLVKGSLGMNIISTITAGIAVIFFTLDVAIPWHYNYYCRSYDCRRMELMYTTRSCAISGMLLLFSILEFIVSIYVSAFACRALSDSTFEAVFIQNPHAPINTVTPGYLPSSGVNIYDTIHLSGVGQSVLNNCDPVKINSKTTI